MAGVTTMWFFKRKDETERDQAMYYFRLVEPDFTPMPVYEHMSAYLNALRPTLYAGRHQESAWQLTYTGQWSDTASPSTILGHYRYSDEAGAQLEVTWEGRTLTLTPGPGEGVVRITGPEDTRREIALHSDPVRLSRQWFAQPQSLTLTVVAGSVSIDEFWVQ